MRAHASQFTPVQKTPLDQLIEDLIDLQAEGDATRSRLIERGHAPAFLDENMDRARQSAMRQFMRVVPAYDAEARKAAMAMAISELLPPKQLIVAELQARDFSVAEIDAMLDAAGTFAAREFAGLFKSHIGGPAS